MQGVLYPVSELASRYGASVEEETTDPDHAYAPLELERWARPSRWDRLPWAQPQAQGRPGAAVG